MKLGNLVAFAIFVPVWFVTVFFVGAHIWLSYETGSTKDQMCKALSDEVGITIHYQDFKRAGCPDPH